MYTKKLLGLVTGFMLVVTAPNLLAQPNSVVQKAAQPDSMTQQALTKTTTKPVLNIQHWKTANGSRVYYVASPEVAMVEINVVFDAGSSRDGDKPGLAQITANMLNQGSMTMNADQIAKSFDDVGALFGASTNRDFTAISLQSLSDKKYFDPALQVFMQILSAPKFPEKAFLRTQQQTLNAIEAARQEPGQVAKNAFYAAIYGKQAYSHPVLGNKQSVTALTPAALASFYKQYYVAKNALITIVGDVNRQQAENIANQISGKLATGDAASKLTLATSNLVEKAINIKFPSEQTHILIGQVGINHNDPDYFPLIVGNYILGGAPLTSILFSQVREQRGLAYNVGSVFMPLVAKGPFAVMLQTRNNQAALALKVTEEILMQFVKNGVSNEQVLAAKKKIINSFPLAINSDDKISGEIVNMGFYHLPLNYLDTYRQNVAKVTTAQIKNAFEHVLHPNKMVVVIVGNAEKIK